MTPVNDSDWQLEIREWLDSLLAVRNVHGPKLTEELVRELVSLSSDIDVPTSDLAQNTRYRNTISVEDQPAYPGDIKIESRLENYIRWNAMAMVLKANDSAAGLGGHIATYASAGTMLEVGFNHFFRGRSSNYSGDIVNVQPHAAPGIYARAFLEGRFNENHIENFRRELAAQGGLSSYPHPRRMPNFWPCPTASMGLSAVTSIHIAKFAKYLEHRQLLQRPSGRVWCFLGDGECDEPEVLGSINAAYREKLDNLVFVVNCNLQRLDGPVRGNGKVIQELERAFRASKWQVIKVVWGSEWDAILARDENDVLQKRMDTAVDGDYQYYSTAPGEKVREHWVAGNSELEELMRSLTDEEIRTIQRGGHDRKKIYAAYSRAIRANGRPVVILCKTVKGYGMGSKKEGRNAVHQDKSLSDVDRQDCARRFGIPLSESAIANADFYHPGAESREIRYLMSRRKDLSGDQPFRQSDFPPIDMPADEVFEAALCGTERSISTTMSFVRLLAKLLQDSRVGRFIVPIVPDEARTFGMESLFRRAGIYSASGQKYRAIDADTISPYKETENGQILQEGICESGAIASFLAAGTAYANFGVPTIPFYVYYSMFGFQRVGDMIWACADSLCKGFLIGGTAGRSTLNGEGLQHQDGHSHVLANTVPSLISYDPAFGYEVAVIIREGIRRMYVEKEDIFYYLTVYNENYVQPAAPENVDSGILKGMYLFRASRIKKTANARVHCHLFGSGSIMQQVLNAQEMLQELGVSVDVWSITSYSELYRDATECDAWNRENPNLPKRKSHIANSLVETGGFYVAVSDYMKVLPASIAAWMPGKLICLGTDGFGLSESRERLRDHFGISSRKIVEVVLLEFENMKQ